MMTLHVCESRATAEIKERNDLGAQVGNKEQEVEMKIHKVTANYAQCASGHVESASQSGNNRVLRSVRGT